MNNRNHCTTSAVSTPQNERRVHKKRNCEEFCTTFGFVDICKYTRDITYSCPNALPEQSVSGCPKVPFENSITKSKTLVTVFATRLRMSGVFFFIVFLYIGFVSQSTFAADAFDEIDESALFGDTSVIVDSDSLTDSGSVVNEREEKSVAFSGAITGYTQAQLLRTWFDHTNIENTTFGGGVLGNFYGDFRLPFSVKSFVNTEIQYSAANDSASFRVRELFLDWNIRYKAFFRFGKQVLQWGRGYFFNPVDLVNVEKKPFFDELAAREGTFGLKLHIPFQTRANIYGFLSMAEIPRIDSVAFSLKAEVLIQATEFALSIYNKKGSFPVYGFDISTRLGNFSVTGELALHQGLVQSSVERWLELPDGTSIPLVSIDTTDFVPRISLGLARYFDVGNFNDRMMITIEGYYNHVGNTDEDFKAILPPGIKAGAFTQREDSDSLLNEFMANVFDFNNYSRWYAAAFMTFNRFILTDMTLSASVLYNLNQRCAMVTAGLNYTTQHNLSFDVIVNGFPGKDMTEYTIAGQGLTGELRVGILF